MPRSRLNRRSMTKGRGLRIVLGLLAAVLFGAAATHTARAQSVSRAQHSSRRSQFVVHRTSRPMSVNQGAQGSAPVGGHPTEGSGAEPTTPNKAPGVTTKDNAGASDMSRSNPAGGKKGLQPGSADTKGRDVKASPMPSEERPVTKSVTTDDHSIETRAPESRAPDLNAIDTRITVQPRRPSSKPGETPERKFVISPKPPRNPSARGEFAPGSVNRNAIGTLVVRPEVPHAGGGEPAGQISAKPVGTEPGSVAKIDPTLQPHVMPQPKLNPVSPIAVNRGMINGTTMIRRGSAPTIIGGPAKASAGGSGSAFRARP
jgi:hypothetical protein